MTALPASTQRVVDAAHALGLEIEVREFPEGTRTAEDAARAVGVTVGQIVKTLIFLADTSPVVCFVSGVNRLDTQRLAAASGAAKIGRADADAVRAATGYAVGGVPPFGYPAPLTAYCDPDLLQYDAVWVAGGTPHSVFPIDPHRLVEVTSAQIVNLKEES